MKQIVLAILVLGSSIFAEEPDAVLSLDQALTEESKIIQDLNVEVSYGIMTNLIDRGQSLTANTPTGAGGITFSYYGFILDFATYGSGGPMEIDTVIGYEYDGIENLTIGATFLSISYAYSDTGIFQFNNDREASIYVGYSIPDTVDIGLDIMANINTYNFLIYQLSLAKSFGNLGTEILLAQQTSNTAGNQFAYYQFAMSYPSAITGGEW